VPTESVGFGADVAGRLGAPDWILEPRRWEFLCNALVFAPVPLLGVLAWPGSGWLTWVLLCLAGSVGVEVAQAALLPERSATAIDVVANTTGAVLGSLAAILWESAARERRQELHRGAGRDHD